MTQYLFLCCGRAEDSIEAELSLLVLPHVFQGQLVRDDESLLLAPASLELQHGPYSRVHTDLALHVLHLVEVLLAHDALILQAACPNAQNLIAHCSPALLGAAVGEQLQTASHILFCKHALDQQQ